MQMIETPILIRHGIGCQPLLLSIEGKQVQSFVLDNVSQEWADLLPANQFLEINKGSGRYITIKPVETSLWESIFPGVKTQLSEPKEMEAPSAGRSISVPSDVQDFIKNLTDDQLLVLIQEQREKAYVASFEVYRYSAVQGLIDKSFVPPILESAAKSLLENQPNSVYLISFLNKLFEETGQNECVCVDTIRLFDVIAKLDRFHDLEYTGALPLYLSRTQRLSAWVNKDQFQIVAYNDSSKQLFTSNFSSLSECYKYCHEEGYVNLCSSEQIIAIKEQVELSSQKWPACPRFDDLRSLLQQNNSTQMMNAEGGRYIYLPEGVELESFMYADPLTRFIYKLYSNGSTSTIVAIDNWLQQESVRDSNLLFLIWGGAQATWSEDGGLLTYKDVGHLFKNRDLKSVASRRRLLDTQYWSDLYNPGHPDYNLSKRVYLAVFYDMVRGPFIAHLQKQSSVESFIGALSYVREVVVNAQGDDIFSLFLNIKQTLLAQGVLLDHALVSVATSMSHKGKQLFQDLQCSCFSEKQRLIRLFADPQYALEYLVPKMSMNWPSENLWWLEGFDLNIDESGWGVFRKGHRLLAGYESKVLLMSALKDFICNQRVKPLEESDYYLSRNGVRYRLAEGQEVKQQLATVDVFHLRPQKRKKEWPTSSKPINEFQINEYIDEMDCNFEEAISGVLHSLSNVLSIPSLNLSLCGELGMHVTGSSEEPLIALWTRKAGTNAPAGGVAYAWAQLLYGELIQRHARYTCDDQIYFPDVNNGPLKDLFDSILLKNIICKPSSELFEYEREIIASIETETNLSIAGGISQMDDDDFCALCAALMSMKFERRYELLRGIQQTRTQWQFLNGNRSVHVLNNFSSASRDRALERDDECLVKGESLFSRAFEAYVEDCLQILKQPNDLLVYGTTNEDRMGIRVYPDGDERFRIRLAFDTFFSEYAFDSL